MINNTIIRFYTDSGIYMGWQKYKYGRIPSYANWMRSGNYIMVRNREENKDTKCQTWDNLKMALTKMS